MCSLPCLYHCQYCQLGHNFFSVAVVYKLWQWFCISNEDRKCCDWSLEGHVLIYFSQTRNAINCRLGFRGVAERTFFKKALRTLRMLNIILCLIL